MTIKVAQMIYSCIHKGTFISRPNRFIAEVDIDGKTEICHVKNTGRCKELLVPGATVYANYADSPLRSTNKKQERLMEQHGMEVLYDEKGIWDDIYSGNLSTT